MTDLGGLPHVTPMLAVSGSLPTAAADPSWAYELKWDGIRAVAYAPGDGSLTLLTRNDNDVTARYPELTPLGEALAAAGHACVLDGEIVALAPDGRPSFGALQRRMNLTRGAVIARLAAEVPVDYMAFDVLHLDGGPTLRLPYRERRALLAELRVEGAHWRTPPHWEGHGSEASEMTRRYGLEGLLAKRLSSPYLPGRRSDLWLKIKNVRTQEVVVGGWTEGAGSRSDAVGGLLMGVWTKDGGLAYAGTVGSGFSRHALEVLRERLAGLARDTSPFAGPVADRHVRAAGAVHWVEPELVGEVTYGEWTATGVLRHPVWRGLRPDKGPEEARAPEE
ncbi:non-homologous end-joining DNA ligase [Streptomyces sp. WMMC500]|uniref:non-homologous end-joining DNA ligase n=1 Tax=Streptomyces sp. WMMC500 TaxID=3015154 RepID=UPI00248B4632|nr:non-homologous end-joining DNA ligase [Streptomyces sp. WMMC500]WBB59727.1 non-homologous end-joining DNA ligase [Streptomyces sp. WMMC500]